MLRLLSEVSIRRGAEGGAALPQVSGTEKLHSLIFAMLFPAFHGAFLLAIFITGGPSDLPPWGPLLAVYFAAQFVEGIEARTAYTLPRAVVNLAEIALMVLIFTALGYFPGVKLPLWLMSTDAVRWLIFAALILPAAHRVLFRPSTMRRGSSGYLFARTLTAMSLAAALLSLLVESLVAWSFVLVILLAYMLLFQFANGPLVDALTRWKLSWAADLRRPSGSGQPD